MASNASRHYAVFEIDKRNGKGKRKIEQPSRTLKAIQRWLERNCFGLFPIHDSSIGYRKGLSIKTNAERHSKFPYTLRVDFENFFWSFREEDIVEFLIKNNSKVIDLSNKDMFFVSKIVTRNGRLVMGAPSSPILTNIIMHDIDAMFAKIALEHDSAYTRYADDLFFSSTHIGKSSSIKSDVIKYIQTVNSPVLRINNDKTAYLSKKNKRLVTGLTVTTDGAVSVGRDRKRMIKSLVHSAIHQKLDDENKARLVGYINWIKSVDWHFYVALCAKYGEKAMLNLVKDVSSK